MSSHDAFWNQFEKFIKEEHNLNLEEFRNLMTIEGDGFRDRFEKICEILLLHPQKGRTHEIMGEDIIYESF